MHFFLPILLLVTLLGKGSECTGHPNPLALNMLRSLDVMGCKPAIAHYMRFVREEASFNKELEPLRRIHDELETFLESTCKEHAYHPQCEIQPVGQNVYGQCEVKNMRDLGHCAVTVVRSSPNSSLDVKCWHAGSGERFVNLVQEPGVQRDSYNYTLTTDSTCPKFFEMNNTNDVKKRSF